MTQQKIYNEYIKNYINFKYPIINKKHFAKWFVGFTDGDGFFLVKKHNNNIYFEFIINQHSSNYLLLLFIKSNLNLKTTIKKHKYKEMYTMYINYKDINDIIIPFFNKHKLKSSKSLQFKYFYHAWQINKDQTLNKYQKFEKINKLKKPNRKQYISKKNIKINDFWLNGFIEADGSFHLKLADGRLYHCFSISKTLDFYLLHTLKHYLHSYNNTLIARIYSWNHTKSLTITGTNQLNNANYFFTKMYKNTFSVGIKSLQFKIWSQSLTYKTSQSSIKQNQLQIARDNIRSCKKLFTNKYFKKKIIS